jgi:hypothetical protein
MKKKTQFEVVWCIVLKLGSAGRPRTGTGPSLWKNKNNQKLAWGGGLTQSKTRLQSVDYFVFTKTMLFWFIKKVEVDPSDPGLGPGL